MKRFKCLSLLLVLGLALSACSAETEAQPTASPQNTIQPVATAKATAEPTPAPPTEEDVMPILTVASIAATADDVQAFDGQPDAAYTDAFFYLVLRNEAYPTGMIGINEEGGYRTVRPDATDTLYPMYFDGGSFPGLPSDGLGISQDGAYAYMMGDPGDLLPVCTILDTKALGNGLYQYSVSIARKSSSDGSVEPIGSLNFVLRQASDSYFGYTLVSMTSFDQEDSVSVYFGKDASEAMTQLEPLFESVALSACSFNESFDGQPSDELAWSTAYLLLNHHSADFNGIIKQNNDGTISIVQLDGRWFHMDPTFESSETGGAGLLFFGMDDTQPSAVFDTATYELSEP